MWHPAPPKVAMRDAADFLARACRGANPQVDLAKPRPGQRPLDHLSK
jgi:hypothetical protein